MIGQPIAKTAYDPDRKGLAMFPTNFKDLEWLVKRCAMPVVVKGVLRGDDARRCVDCGVKGIMVSNHGGRHLDTTVTTAEVLSEIVEAVGSNAEVYVDGGIRRGTDIVKALALGARAVLLGRPPLWGLSVAGADGVRAVMEHMHDEMVRAMQLCGAASLAALTPDLVKTSSIRGGACETDPDCAECCSLRRSPPRRRSAGERRERAHPDRQASLRRGVRAEDVRAVRRQGSGRQPARHHRRSRQRAGEEARRAGRVHGGA